MCIDFFITRHIFHLNLLSEFTRLGILDLVLGAGGLTENDFILAAKISGLNLHNLLRITPTSK